MTYHPPVNPIGQYTVWPGTGWLDRGYELSTGALHTGIDLNDRRGGDSDLGAPVYAVTRGTVVAAGRYPVWGQIVLVECPGPGLWLQYAHLNHVLVSRGQEVEAGQLLGSVGKGDRNRYPAHLHFEVRLRGLEVIPADYWPSAQLDRKTALAFVRSHYANPLRWLQKVGAVPWWWATQQQLSVREVTA